MEIDYIKQGDCLELMKDIPDIACQRLDEVERGDSHSVL